MPQIDHLVVVHYHLRAGGVRRIIELALPHLLRARPEIRRVTLCCGEASEPQWIEGLRGRISPVPCDMRIDSALKYYSEQRRSMSSIRTGIDRFMARVLGNESASRTVVWAHNLGVGRNLLLSSALAQWSDRAGFMLVSHHHDFWFENRWGRWPEMRECGFRTLSQVARAVLPGGRSVVHVAINRFDYEVLAGGLGGRAIWMPNLAQADYPPALSDIADARRWLAKQVRDDAPIWIVPSRLLRRKNFAEAILLTRWLRPEAWLVTTGGVSSVEERFYAKTLAKAVRAHGWRVKLGILATARDAPPVPHLVAASELVLLTSVQEGFGLPYLEAAAVERPLLARKLPNVLPDLDTFGLQLPHVYEEIWIERALIDWDAERQRQRQLWREWRRRLPKACRESGGVPPFLRVSDGELVPFSRLTLSGQLGVLAVPAEVSFARCAEFNPLISGLKRRVEGGGLKAARWNAHIEEWIGGRAYARRFWTGLDTALAARSASPVMSVRTHATFIQQRLGDAFLYPLLISERS